MNAAQAAFWCLVLLVPSGALAGDFGQHHEDSAMRFTSASVPVAGSMSYVAPKQIGEDRMLFGVGSTLYALDGKAGRLWSFDAGADINGFVWLAKQATVYMVTAGLTLVALDAETGEEKWSASASGRASFSEIYPHGDDHFIMRLNMTGYDQEHLECVAKKTATAGKCARTTPDVVELHSDSDLLGQAKIPGDAEIFLVGRSVWAVTAGSDSVSLMAVEFSPR